MTQNKKLISLGFLVPLVFWFTIMICGFMTPDYSHLSDLVSELGMKGAETQYIFTAGSVIKSILSVFFIVGLYKSAKRMELSTAPILILLVFPISTFGTGIFPMPTLLHSLFDILLVLFNLSPLLAIIRWNKAVIPYVNIVSIVVLLLFNLVFLRGVPNTLDHYPGLLQRLAHLGWSVWFIYLSCMFIKNLNEEK